jgi:hypothetical protein
MVGDLRVLLRYGIVGYLVLFFDLALICSYMGSKEFFAFFKDAQIGIVFAFIGLPIGWLCYQLWDECINRFWIPKTRNIRRIQEWENEFREMTKVQSKKVLEPRTIKVIANISLSYIHKSDDLIPDPRSVRHSIYSDSQQARGVMWFVLPITTYLTYLIIGVYVAIKLGFANAMCPIDKTIYLMALISPIIVFIISYWGFRRVLNEQDEIAWTILSSKKCEIKRLIEAFYTSNSD